jgi:hypothetical protein
MARSRVRELKRRCLPSAVCQTSNHVAMTNLEQVLCKNREERRSGPLASSSLDPQSRTCRQLVRETMWSDSRNGARALDTEPDVLSVSRYAATNSARQTITIANAMVPLKTRLAASNLFMFRPAQLTAISQHGNDDQDGD